MNADLKSIFTNPTVFLAVGLMFVIVMMVLPMPSWVLDVGLSASFAFAILIFTDWHDYVILAGSGFGLLALIGMFVGLYQSGNRQLLTYGIFCMSLVIFNNVYYFAGYTIGLPLMFNDVFNSIGQPVSSYQRSSSFLKPTL